MCTSENAPFLISVCNTQTKSRFIDTVLNISSMWTQNIALGLHKEIEGLAFHWLVVIFAIG